jgi:nucleoside-diphosphate-sugar epimerase
VTPRRVLIAGCGYLGAAAATRLRDRSVDVCGARRRIDKLPASVLPAAVDLLDGDLAALPRDLDAVVWALSPEPNERGYRRAYVDGPRRLLRFLADRGDPVRRVVLVSSTSVWHRNDGADVDERTPPSPVDFRGKTVIEGERALADGPFEAVVLRLSGIYGPGRTRLLDGIARGQLAPPRRAVHGNRIHRDDAAKAIDHVLHLASPARCYVVSDDDPADLREVYAWLAGRLGTTLPPATDCLPRRGGDKRCRNALLRASGFSFDVPDYQAGYGHLLQER